MLKRLSNAALSGTRIERKTRVSSRNDSTTTAVMNHGSRSFTRSPMSPNAAVAPPTCARAGLSSKIGGMTLSRMRFTVSKVASS